MKKRMVTTCFFMFISLFVLYNIVLTYNTGTGPPPSRTGAPGEGTCIDAPCHGGTGTGSVTLNFSGSNNTYLADSTYSVTVNVSDPAPSQSLFGFQLTVLNENNNFTGSYTSIPASTITQTGMGRTYINHSGGGANSTGSWTFDWTAPSTNEGGITFYFAGNAANGNGAASGDNIYTNTFVVAPDSTPPVANFIANDTVVCTGRNVLFSDSSEGVITAWEWDFGNGATPATANTQGPHNVTYSTTGMKTVMLIVTTQSRKDTMTRNGYMDVGLCPDASFAASDSMPCIDSCISFTDLSTNGPSSWTWTFDGAATGSSTMQHPDNICYPATGAFDVTLITSNSYGSDTLTRSGYVAVDSCLPPDAAFSASDTTFCAGGCIDFTDLSTGNPDQWDWSFPGATPDTSTMQHPTGICYDSAGTYAVRLIVFNEHGPDTLTQTAYIEVDSCIPPVPEFAASDTVICAGDCIAFTDMSTDAQSWQWSFTGATPDTSTMQHPGSICYPDPGTYDVQLTASNVLGDSTLTKTDYITVHSFPVVAFTVSEDPVLAGVEVTFTNNSTADADRFIWYFGDGDTLATNQDTAVTHIYSVPGTTHTVILVAYNDSCRSEASEQVTIVNNIDDQGAGNAVRLYPNPAQDLFEVMVPQATGNVQIMVYNQVGATVFTTNGKVPMSRPLPIDVSQWKGGMYVVKIQSASHLWVKKVMVQ